MQKKIINNPEEYVCCCGENFYTDYWDSDHGQILTRNLNIVIDLVLRGYLLHDTKSRLRRVITKNHAFKRVKNNIGFLYTR